VQLIPYDRNLGFRDRNIQGTKKLKVKSVVRVRERTISIERPPLVEEVSVYFCGKRVLRGQRDGSLLSYSHFSRPSYIQEAQVKISARKKNILT
jgi:hypothetical protein